MARRREESGRRFAEIVFALWFIPALQEEKKISPKCGIIRI